MKDAVNVLSIEHLVFIPCTDEQLKNNDILPYFHVCSRKFNNKVYKKKNAHLGFVATRNKKEWVFCIDERFKGCLSFETMLLITKFMSDIRNKKINYDFKSKTWET